LKKLYSILIICLFTFNFGGTWIIYETRRMHIYREMEKEVRSAQGFEIIQLTKQEFDRYSTRENEICLKGKMYDFAKVEQSGDHVVLYCIRDTKEETLKADFYRSLEDKHSKTNDKLLSQFSQLFSLTYLAPAGLNPEFGISSPRDFYDFEILFTSISLLNDTPPPKA
jgi:hypothetical protein